MRDFEVAKCGLPREVFLNKVTGEPPLKYMTGLRIIEAKRLFVAFEDMDIKAGLNPSEYRQRLQ